MFSNFLKFNINKSSFHENVPYIYIYISYIYIYTHIDKFNIWNPEMLHWELLLSTEFEDLSYKSILPADFRVTGGFERVFKYIFGGLKIVLYQKANIK